MTRRLKVLGALLSAVLVLGAVVAAGAQADEFTAESYPVTIKGEQVSTEKHVLTVEGGRKIECETVSSMSRSTLTGPSTELTMDPTYSKCHAIILGSETDVTVTFEGCDIKFTTAKNAAGTSRITHLTCEGTHDVTIHVYNEKAGVHNEEHEICAYTIQAQTVENGITYENMAASGTTKKDFTVKTNSTGIVMKRVKGTKVKCGEENLTASFQGNTTFQGENPTTHAEIGIDVG